MIAACAILACHSWPQYLPGALDSIRAQTVQFARTIVVLDGPPEPERYEEILVTYPWVTPIWLPTNQGQSVARNTGVRAAIDAGLEWYVFLDEDDEYHPQFLEKVSRSVELCPDRDIHYCDWVKTGGWVGYTKTPEYSYRRLLAAPFITTASLVKTEVWEDVKSHNGHGFDPGLRGWEDYQFFLESGALGHYGARVGLALVRYRRHDQSVSDYAHAHLDEIVAHIRDKMRRLYDVKLKYEVPAGWRRN